LKTEEREKAGVSNVNYMVCLVRK